jgi:uncharacterized protein (TIGR02145 family)
VKKGSRTLFFPSVILAAFLMLVSGCIKKDDNYVFFYPEPSTVKDIDGNIYHLIYVKGQTWMTENLKTTRYHNGDAIANVKDGQIWETLKSGAYCNYNNDTAMSRVYGRLYNWHAVSTRNLCPYAFHVPYDFEWQTLIDTLGGISVAGGILKEAGNSHWQDNTGATNYYGFTARPGGSLDSAGTFRNLGLRGNWWSGTEYLSTGAWLRTINNDDAGIFRSEQNKTAGYSVRCIRDY